MSTQTNHTLWGSNVSFAWLEWNNSYKVTLSVRDSGFRDADPAKPNTGNFTRNVNVQIDSLLHADLRLEAGTLKVTPTDPAEGDLVTVTVNVTNKPGRASAGHVTTDVRTLRRGVKAGEWRPLRGRRGEKGGEEERKPRRKVKEEKKRL